MTISTVDLIVVALYALILLGAALFVSRTPDGEEKSVNDYFLAGSSLPWWAIGASLIAANISAEQIIGMSGQGYVVGLAIAAYEWQAAIVLLVVARFFLPIFLKRGIYTMPQFLQQRFGTGVKTLMSVYWLVLYTAVNLTTVLWLGALAINTLTGLSVFAGMAALAVFAVAYSTYGGLKAVALTDIIQVTVLVIGGFAIAWLTLTMIGGDQGLMGGLSRVYSEVPGKFVMILERDHPNYGDLPGIWTLLGGLWVLHFSYWGFNQYIIQRALGAKSIGEAQTGLAFAAFLKLLMPLIIVLPGIAAYVLAQPEFGNLDASALAETPDRTYPELMRIMPGGLRGLIFAALLAAIVSSLASMMNSISTIFTLDVYRAMRSDETEQHYVRIGRITAATAIVIALFLAQPLLGSLASAFQVLQEYTGFIAPGVVAVFLTGMFWRRTTHAGALAMLITSVVANIVCKFALADLAFIIRIWLVFLLCLVIGAIVSMAKPQSEQEQSVGISDVQFTSSASFNVMSLLIVAILVGLYAIFW
ncbi:MAG: sodium/sugar symporter [Pseudomonadota bacterium]